MVSSSRVIVPSSTTLPASSHQHVYQTCPTASLSGFRTWTRSTIRAASRPETRYLYRGDTSISAAASRIALYSMSQESAYALAAQYPAHSRHWSLRLRAWVLGSNAVPVLMAGDGPTTRT